MKTVTLVPGITAAVFSVLLGCASTGDTVREEREEPEKTGTVSTVQSGEVPSDLLTEPRAEPAELIQAVKNGNSAEVRRILESGTDPDSQDQGGLTALIYAISLDNIELVRVLLNAGADAERPVRDGVTPLMIAAHNGSIQICNLLVESWASVNAPDPKTGGTPLMFAILQGHQDTAGFLIESGADLEARDNGGNTALMSAIHTGQNGIAEMLIEAGADVNTADNEGWPALMVAAEKGNPTIAGLLIRSGAAVDCRNNGGATPALIAAANGHPDVLKVLLEAGADAGARDDLGWTPLMIAARYGHTGIAQLLLENGADPDSRNNRGATALMTAAEQGHTELYKLLINAGADDSIKDNEGRTALVYSISKIFENVKTKQDVPGCEKLPDSGWKEGAEQVTVAVSGIDFGTLSADSKPEEQEIYQQLLWDTFANKCEEDRFGHITTENWFEKWIFYKDVLVRKAETAGFSGEQLRQCIEVIEPRPDASPALLPVGVYRAESDSGNVWIIICKWEYADQKGSGDYLMLGHICGWALRESDREILTFFTCS